MCCHHRSRYGSGYGHHGYTHGYTHHRGGPISALVALAQKTTEKQPLPQEPYQPYQEPPPTRLAPQTSGRTTAPAPPHSPISELPRDPPPAYEDANPSSGPPGPLEKSLDEMYISSPPPAAGAVGARDYQPTARQPSSATQASTPREMVGDVLDPSSRWAARLQRKEERARAKLARKAEKYARRERRDVERGC